MTTPPVRLRGTLGDDSDNNLNYVVLGEVILQANGGAWAQVMREDLLGPAGLDRVWVQDAQETQPPLTVAVADSHVAVVTGQPLVAIPLSGRRAAGWWCNGSSTWRTRDHVPGLVARH